MSNINWDEIDKQNNNQNFKEYAPNGEYKVKLDHVEIRDKATWRSPALEFHWKETESYKFPKSCTHWLSITNPAWRASHNRAILIQFGIEKKKAQELVEVAERDQDRAKLVKGYEELYKRIADRGNEVTITVHDQYDRDGKPVMSPKGYAYTESDFKQGARMANAPKKGVVADMIGDDTELNLSDIPF